MEPHAAPAGEAVHAELLELLTSLLPEAWRHDVRVELAPGNLTLYFRDADGRAHGFDIRHKHEGVPSLVEGDALAYSYQNADPSAEPVLLLDAHRSALAAFAARDADIAPWVSRTLTTDPVFAQSAVQTRHDLDPAPSALAARVAALLPEAWRREVTTFTTASGFVVRFRDAEGQRHALEGRRLNPSEPALVAGKALGFAYQLDDPSLDVAAWIDRYREALAAFVAHEDELVAMLPEPKAHTANPAVALDDDAPPAPEGFLRALTDMLPPAWRRDVAATWLPGNGGAALRFRDEHGVLHLFDIRRMVERQPALVPGAVLGFSYAVADDRLDESAAVTKYRELFQSWVAREAELDALLGEPPAQG